jgi:hypothetical protein
MDTNRNSRLVIFLGSFATALAIGGAVTGCSDDDDAGSQAPKDIVATASAAGTFNTMVAALGAADLTATLQTAGPFTVFAPTDAAFAKLPAGTVDELLKPENKAILQEVLKYHVVAGDVRAAEVVTLTSATTLHRRRDRLRLHRQGQRRHRHCGRRRGVERRHPRHRHGAAAALKLTPPEGESSLVVASGFRGQRAGATLGMSRMNAHPVPGTSRTLMVPL